MPKKTGFEIYLAEYAEENGPVSPDLRDVLARAYSAGAMHTSDLVLQAVSDMQAHGRAMASLVDTAERLRNSMQALLSTVEAMSRVKQ